MSRLFTVNSNGLFRIKVNQLVPEQSTFPNRTFLIPIVMTDNQGFTNRATVLLTLSNTLNNVRCPRISDTAICNFAINLTQYDSSKYKIRYNKFG